jgi:uncharacterized membrane protein YebE (DUF533 family)
MEFFPEIPVSPLQGEAIARGLYGVAQSDGVHERELALISDIYQQAVAEEGTPGATAASLDRDGAVDPAALAAILPPGAHRALFIKAAWLLAWADGAVSAAERAKIAEYGKALGVEPDVQSRLESEVKDFLLRPLAGLANVEAVAAVAKKLGL